MTLTPEQRETENTKRRAKYHRRYRWIAKYKVSQGCCVCGYNEHPAALDFDHIDPSTKLFLIPRCVAAIKLKRLIAEIRKCRIICANCHRIHSRAQWNDGTTYKPNPRKSDVQVQS